MGVYIVKTNELCGSCVYLPAEDVPDPVFRATAIELNDLCSTCLNNSKKLSIRPLKDDEQDLSERVRKSSPYLKSNGWV